MFSPEEALAPTPKPSGIPQDLWDANEALEIQSLDAGRARYLAIVASCKEGGDEALTTYGRTLLARSVEPMADALKAWVDSSISGKPGPRHEALGPIVSLKDIKLVAWHVCKVMVDEVSDRCRTANQVAFVIAERLETELRCMHLEKNEPKLFTTILVRGRRNSQGYADMRAALIRAANKGAKLKLPKWDKGTKAVVGGFLMHMFCHATGIAKVVEEQLGPKLSVCRVHPTEETTRWIGTHIERVEDSRPQYQPMLCPPRNWDNPYEGGYWHIPLTLVKKAKPTYLEELTNTDLSTVYCALNALQNTAWEVNPVVLHTMQTLWDEQSYDRDFMVKAEPAYVPKYNPDLPEKERNELGQNIAAALGKNREDIGRRGACIQTLKMAQDYVGSRIWFPYNLDFRGRIYPLVSHLSPQGEDQAKGLLRFARGKVIDNKEQLDWLAIHGANCWGKPVDKAPFKNRLQWITDHEDMIIQCASDPLTYRKWMDAENPFQFLAFCLEWTEYLGEGLGVFESRLAVSVDGTCSGLQHYSAILRDPKGGLSTNLIPSEAPADIYDVVAKKTMEKVQALAADGDPMAIAWASFGFDRNCTKRPVMTLPYGATQYAAQQYTIEYLNGRMSKLAKSGGTFVFPTNRYSAAIWLAKLIWEAIGETVVAARHAMDWLHELAQLVAKSGNPVWWTAPTGFQICQSYINTKQRRVKAALFGKSVFVTYREDGKGQDPSKASNGLAPNFIHSMDAAALMLTVKSCVEDGVDHFGMIHDSYACHASDMPVLFKGLREQFIKMYTEHDVLAEFEASVREILGPDAKIPPRPVPGSLNLESIRDSLYFFS